MRYITIITLLVSSLVVAEEKQIFYNKTSGKIVARESLTCSFGGLNPALAVIIADIPDSVTHVTTKTVPPGQRKKVVQAKKGQGITSDTVAAVDALIAAVPDKKTREALIAIKALIVEELPSE